MQRFKDVRMTCEQIAGGSTLDLDHVQSIMARCKPKAVSESGMPLYSIQQMVAAMFRGDQKKVQQNAKH